MSIDRPFAALSRGTLALLALAAALAAAPAPAGEPLDLSIAKKKDGPYRSDGQYIGLPDAILSGDNPQWVHQRLPRGESRAAFVRLENPNPTGFQAYVDGAESGNGLKIRYYLKGENVSEEVRSCSPFQVPATGRIRFKMTIRNVDAISNQTIYSPFAQGDADCDPYFDRVWAGSKIPG